MQFLDVKLRERVFPGSSEVKTSPSNTRGEGSIPGQGAKITHTLWPKKTTIKQKQYCSKFNKNLKNGAHQKRKKNLKNFHHCFNDFYHYFRQKKMLWQYLYYCHSERLHIFLLFSHPTLLKPPQWTFSGLKITLFSTLKATCF